MFAALLCTVLFSVSIVCGHRSARMIGGAEANFWRLTCAALFLGCWSFIFGAGLAGDAFPVFLISGVIGIGIGDSALFQALPRLGSRLSMLLIQCLTAPFGALIEWMWLGTRLSPAQIWCGLTILLGVGIALLPGKHLRYTRRELIAGSLLSVLSALAGALGAVLSRKAYEIAHTANQPIGSANAAFQRAVGGLLITAVGLLIVKRRELRTHLRGSAHLATEVPTAKWRSLWPWVLVNGFAGQTLGVTCMQRALETTPTGVVLSIIALTPVVVIPFAFFFEHERPSLHSVLGGVLAVSGAIGLVLSR